MQEKHLFEYAVIRVVPRVEREEFINVGIIIFCKKKSFLKAVFDKNDKRLRAFCSSLELDLIYKHFDAFVAISKGESNCGPIGKLDTPSRFRWLTATRSTVLQSSKIHPGFCYDLEMGLQKLFTEYVL